MKDAYGQPERFYAVAEKALSLSSDFSGFGTDISQLKKRLRKGRVELFDSFPPYGAYFRRRFGIEGEQALELFHQTVSMKSVGNLTDFVRHHMLEPFDVAPRVLALIAHFDDLNRAHEAVLKAKQQVELLTPLVADCDKHAALLAEVDDLRAARGGLKHHFARLKLTLLDERLQLLGENLNSENAKVERLADKREAEKILDRSLRLSIAQCGGDRISRIAEDTSRHEQSITRRKSNAARYDELRRSLGLLQVANAEDLLAQRQTCLQLQAAADTESTATQNQLTELSVEFAQGRAERDALSEEISSLKSRRSNIPTQQIAMRTAICSALGLTEEAVPFAGELLQVRDEERDWEGAIERLLHNFGLSMLVPDAAYPQVAEWVEKNHLKGRLVYFRVKNKNQTAGSSALPDSVVRKLAVKPDSPFYKWLDAEVSQRFNVACCATQEQFRREEKAITRAGQIKAAGERHEKDDRHRLDDRSRYVLGWTNTGKIAALSSKLKLREARLADLGAQIAGLQTAQKTHGERLKDLARLMDFNDYSELDWASLALEVHKLQAERERLEAASDLMRELGSQLAALEAEQAKTETALNSLREKRAATTQKISSSKDLRELTQALLLDAPEFAGSERLTQLQHQALGEQVLSLESCDNREREMRDWLQKTIEAEDKRLARLRDNILKAMHDFSSRYLLETQEVDVAVDAAGDYRSMLSKLAADDLPRFEARFKELLNENTIREVAHFHSQLSRERETIKERITLINQSLTRIDYNPGRYIVLVAQLSSDADVRDFQNELRACLDGTLGGTLSGHDGKSEGDQYSEAKFLQVKQIIERLRGRTGLAELDRRWASKVTDVRNWFVFAASERWKDDDREHEHYSDSGGKSGGQKEKLAYTILAASLAYQFGLEILEQRGEIRSRSFRFVVIDEAFGRGSDESAQYGLQLFKQLNLQLLIVTPLQKIHIIEPFVSSVGFVQNDEGRDSKLRNLTIEEYRAEKTRLSPVVGTGL